MPIPNQFLDCSIYIYPSSVAAQQGTNVGASGFIVSTEEEQPRYFAVTNAHVLEGFSSQGSTDAALRINKKDGSVEIVETTINDWLKHQDGDDIAIHQVMPASDWKFTHFGENVFLRPEYLHDQISLDTAPTSIIAHTKTEDLEQWQEVHKLGVGDDVVVIGRYAQHPGRDRNIPAVRFGHISMIPIDPVEQPDRGGFMQQSLLVECQSISGLSGSPVIGQTRIDHREKRANGESTRYDQMVMLVGVDWGHFDVHGEVAGWPVGDVRVPSGMMCVVPAWKISELLSIANQ